MTKREWNEADYIKIGAVLTAAPRWVGALLAAEGLTMPTAWASWWVVVSAILSACMAFVEGWAFSYVFEAWRNQKDSKSDRLFWLAIISAVVFVLVLAPYIAAQVKGTTVYKMLYNDLLLYAWSILVGFSTIAIVASVGYAQKQREAKPRQEVAQGQPEQQEAQPATKKDSVVLLLKQQPEATHAEIAQLAGVSRQYVSRLAQQNGNHRGQ